LSGAIVTSPNIPLSRKAHEAIDRYPGAQRRGFVLGGRELGLGASIGIALSHDRTEGPKELPKEADTAVYRAKEVVAGCSNRTCTSRP
jgi:GGDEF domain-containing protein